MKDHSIIKRGIAYIVDLYLGALLGTLPISLITLIFNHEMTQNIFVLDKWVGCLASIISLFCLAFYYIFVPLKIYKGQTLGKRLMDIQIAYENPKQLIKRQMIIMLVLMSGGKIVLQLISLISGYDLTTFVIYITSSLSLASAIRVIAARDHKALHDRIIKTNISYI